MATDAPPTLRIGLIGAGRVGIALARALQNHGHAIVAAHAVSENSRNRLAEFLPATDVVSIEKLIEVSQTILLTVPDDVLPDLVRGIAKTIGFKKHQFVIHTSGRFGTEVLAPAQIQGALTMAIHPAMTFTGEPADVDRLNGCPFAITSTEELIPIAAALVLNMGGREYFVAEENRALYHAALSHAANHVNTIINQSKSALSNIGISDPGLFLTPLVQTAVENSLTKGIEALTGPISRGDVETVRAHLIAIENTEIEQSYKALAKATVERLIATNRISNSAALEMLEILK